ncbi:histone acetyltransferase-like protein [Polyplosphaeria fusca]|uniref:Histone acetyltransferase-like protein n=1 Tax=Polyplosphaeria fusca TaxID=682080 RepID=A0A9P4R657_9PLEO|nr:histone acetyltransferase-like protein [Polyplosphaeria fusca]
MPAMLDDPTSNMVRRVEGKRGFFTLPSSPESILPRKVTLKDGRKATIIPFTSPTQVPLQLSAVLCSQLNQEIEKGDTYPMVDPMALDFFHGYWFALFGAVMLLGEYESADQISTLQGVNWEELCLGSFYVKPNYPGRSSHVCNGGFLVTEAARNRGVGRLLGEAYLEWAPKLGYRYSVFNLVYETNVASCRIWDALGFKQVGRIKGCGYLGSYPDQFVDAIIYGYDFVSKAGEA